MNLPDDPLPRIDRRTALQWMLTAAATVAVRDPGALAAENTPAVAAPVKAQGYGPDPSMVRLYSPGDLWPLTLSAPQRQTARALCDLILPADAASPSASAVGVPDFIDEWISSPYPAQAGDRRIVLEGLQWLDDEAQRQFGQPFAALPLVSQTAVCEWIAHPATARPEHKPLVNFFKRYRDLTAGGYFTTPEGMKAIGYVGNMPSATFEGPPLAALQHVGLA